MHELVERYIHQVGRYLPPKERAEIEAELRSQIEDQLDDRFGSAPTPADVASVLTEWGHPAKLARSYREDQVLIGPDIYPLMMTTLRYGWLIVPPLVLFMNVLAALTSSVPVTFAGLVLEPLLAALYATFIFSALVVLIFAIVQRSGVALPELAKPFNPVNLPQVDDPGVVDRFESAFGIMFGAVIMLLLVYWLQVGGLTLRFNLSDPGPVIPVSPYWIVFLLFIISSIISIHLIAIRSNRWGIGILLLETAVETIGNLGMYFVLYKPIADRLIADNPSLAEIALVSSAPEIIVVIFTLFTLIGKAPKLVSLWNYRAARTTSFFARVGSR